MRLSIRLQAIADIMAKYANHGCCADIGSDHGYLPVWLIQHDIFSQAYACDIADGPIKACQSTVQLSHTEDKISVKKGNGFAPIIGKKLDMISIAGMGGNLICDILENDLDKVEVNKLVIEANVNEPLVRTWLNQRGWKIIDETIVEDMHHFYEIIVFSKGEQSLSKRELYFGPILLKQKTSVFIKKWTWQKQIHENILAQLDILNPKYSQIKQEYEWIREIEMEA